MPVYNEEKYISLCLHNLLKQTLRPTQVIICDNESTDNTKQIAAKILNDSDIPFHIITEQKRILISKWNINLAIWKANKYLRKDMDLVGFLDADVVLDKKYYEVISQGFEKDSHMGLACGVLLPFGFPKPFPLQEPYKMTWGANRVYRYSCWLDLTSALDIRFLPALDTDHNILSYIKGWKVAHFKEAVSRHLRPINPYRGFTRGMKYRCAGYPLWWNIYKALRDVDPGLLVGYTCMALWETPPFPLKYVYHKAITSELRRRITRIL